MWHVGIWKFLYLHVQCICTYICAADDEISDLLGIAELLEVLWKDRHEYWIT